jgi:hypothetical protein
MAHACLPWERFNTDHLNTIDYLCFTTIHFFLLNDDIKLNSD